MLYLNLKNKIPFKYFEMTNFEMLNELYNVLDLYLVTSRIEGGPQALVECGQTKTPILSTNVGIADQILAPESIFDSEDISSFNKQGLTLSLLIKNLRKLIIPSGCQSILKCLRKYMKVSIGSRIIHGPGVEEIYLY